MNSVGVEHCYVAFGNEILTVITFAVSASLENPYQLDVAVHMAVIQRVDAGVADMEYKGRLLVGLEGLQKSVCKSQCVHLRMSFSYILYPSTAHLSTDTKNSRIFCVIRRNNC